MSEVFGNNEETLEFPCDPESLPTSLELPLGDLLLRVKSIKIEKSKENTTGEINKRTGQLKVGGKKMVTAQFQLEEPEELAGIPYTHRFIIGSDSDPEALKEGTWRRNAAPLMKMFKSANVGGKTMSEYLAAVPDQVVGATVKKGRETEQYAARNEIKDFFAPGSKPVKVIEENKNADLDLVMPNPPRAYASND